MSESRPGRHVVRKAPDDGTPQQSDAKETAKIDVRELQGLIERLHEKPADEAARDDEVEIAIVPDET